MKAKDIRYRRYIRNTKQQYIRNIIATMKAKDLTEQEIKQEAEALEQEKRDREWKKEIEKDFRDQANGNYR